MASSSLDSYFNLGALFIMFREVLEAVVIVTILLQLCQKLNAQRLKKWGEPFISMANHGAHCMLSAFIMLCTAWSRARLLQRTA